MAWVEDNIANYNGDGDAIFLTGHSAGAYNVSMVAIDDRYLTAAGTNRDSIKGVAPISGPADFYPFEWPIIEQVFGDAEMPETITQPVKLIPNASEATLPPFLMLHGTNDTTVFPIQSERLSKALNDADHTASYILYDDQDHATVIMALGRIHRGKMPILDDITNFFHAQHEGH